MNIKKIVKKSFGPGFTSRRRVKAGKKFWSRFYEPKASKSWEKVLVQVFEP